MDEQLFQTSNSQIGLVRFTIIRIIAIAALAFSIYDFSENNFFFSILIVASVLVVLLSGPKIITVYKDHLTVSNKSIVRKSPFEKSYKYADLTEVSADIPDKVTDMVLKRVDPLAFKYRFVVIPTQRAAKSFWITTEASQLQKAVGMINQLIGTHSA